MICNIKGIRKGGNYRCMTEIRELEVAIKHNLLTGKSALNKKPFLFFFFFASWKQRNPRIVANYFGVMVYLPRMR